MSTETTQTTVYTVYRIRDGVSTPLSTWRNQASAEREAERWGATWGDQADTRYKVCEKIAYRIEGGN